MDMPWCCYLAGKNERTDRQSVLRPVNGNSLAIFGGLNREDTSTSK